MKPPRLYRKVYVIANEFDPDDYEFPIDQVYIRANLALDEFNNPFWQIFNNIENILDYEYSDFDVNNLNCAWSKLDNPERLSYKSLNKHNPNKSYNRNTITKWSIAFDDCPF